MAKWTGSIFKGVYFDNLAGTWVVGLVYNSDDGRTYPADVAGDIKPQVCAAAVLTDAFIQLQIFQTVAALEAGDAAVGAVTLTKGPVDISSFTPPVQPAPIAIVPTPDQLAAVARNDLVRASDYYTAVQTLVAAQVIAASDPLIADSQTVLSTAAAATQTTLGVAVIAQPVVKVAGP